MAWYNRIFRAQGRTLAEVIRETGHDPLDMFYSGSMTISRDRASTVAAMNRAVSLLAGSMTDAITDSLDVVNIETKKVVKNNLAADRAKALLTESPDGVQPSQVMLEDAATDLLASGSAVFVVSTGLRGKTLNLANPIQAHANLQRNGSVSFTLVSDDDPQAAARLYPESRVIIARWPRLAGRTLGSTSRSRWFGTPPILSLKAALSLALDAESWASGVFKKGSVGSDFAIVYDRALPKEAAENVYKMLTAFSEGRMPLVLTEGAKVQKLSPDPQNANLLALRQFQVEEVARCYGIPAILIGLSDGGNVWGSSVSALEKSFQRYSLRLHLNRFLAPLSHRLLPQGMKFVVDESRAYRGDAEALKNLIETGRPRKGQSPGVMSRSEARSLLGLEGEYKDDWDLDGIGNMGDRNDGNP